MTLRNVALALLALGATASSANAQGFELEQYTGGPISSDGFAVQGTDVGQHLDFGGRLHLIYSHDPLVIERDSGTTESEFASVVEHQLSAQLSGAISLFDRVLVYGRLQVGLVQTGDETDAASIPAADGFSLGDLDIGARVRLVGEPEDMVGVALQIEGTLPLSGFLDQAYSGEDGYHFHPQLLFEVRPGGAAIRANLGVRLRLATELLNLDIGHEMTFGVGASVPVWNERIYAVGELFGATSLSNFGARELSPIQWLLGAQYRSRSGWEMGLAAGTGIQRGYGAGDFRAVLTFGFWPRHWPEADGDRDSDGILDSVDGCPDEPEDFDGVEDQDGCPEADAEATEDGDQDRDGIMDSVDQCPTEPEDFDSFQDEDGCPDLDNDEDGVPDVDDGAPNDPEDHDHFEDEDGVPDPDNDADSVLDPDDNCPLQPGPADNNGCPVNTQVRVEGEQLFTMRNIQFELNRTRITNEARPILNDVARVLRENPQLQHVLVEGHTSDEGTSDHNLDLSRRRARSVVRWLARRGNVNIERLRAAGCGESMPLAPNTDETNRHNNRRVEFRLLDSFEGAVRAGCSEIDVAEAAESETGE